ncbi:MAG: hypothetical protein DRJ03_30625, partial [Chloroflexi bacterium]
MTVSRWVRWWKDNPDRAEAIKKKRRDKYNSDEAFRARVLDRKRIARAKKKKGQKRFPKPRVFHHKGEDIVTWSVGRVAAFLGVHKRTISNLEAKGTIPINRVVDNNGRRWWPKGYIEWLSPFFDLKNSGDLTSRMFSRRVWKEWNESV